MRCNKLWVNLESRDVAQDYSVKGGIKKFLLFQKINAFTLAIAINGDIPWTESWNLEFTKCAWYQKYYIKLIF